MKKKWFCAIAFVAIAFTSTAQKENADIQNIFRVNAVFPGVSYEQRIGRLQSLYVQGFLNPSFGFGYSSTFGSSSFFYLDPAVSLQYRYYYNSARRKSKDRPIERNSMNYIGPVSKIYFSKRRISSGYYEETSGRSVKLVGAVWGMQRNYNNRFALDINVGPAYQVARSSEPYGNDVIEKNVGEFTLTGQVSLGFWLNRRK